MADFVFGNLGDWINGLAADAINHARPEATATLVSTSFGPDACVTYTALKPHATSSAGIGLCRNRFLGSENNGTSSSFISISRIADDSLFADTGISVGMQVSSINNQIPTTPAQAAQLIRTAPRIVTIVAHKPVPGIGRIGESLVAAAVEVDQHGTDYLLQGISFAAMALTECIYVSRLSPHSPFFIHTTLRTGMVVYSINNKRVRTVAAATEAIRLSPMVVTILAETMTLESTESSDLFPMADVIISDTVGDDKDNAATAILAPIETDDMDVLPATALSSDREGIDVDSFSDRSADGTSVEEWHEAVESVPSGGDSGSGSECDVDHRRNTSQTSHSYEPDTSTYIEL